jgi:hypothetical protein
MGVNFEHAGDEILQYRGFGLMIGGDDFLFESYRPYLSSNSAFLGNVKKVVCSASLFIPLYALIQGPFIVA